MDGAMGQEEDVVEAVLTCEGDFHDPELFSRLEHFRQVLKDLLLTEKHKLKVKKVEPWNSVKVTLTIPRDAASRLRQLANSGNDALRQIGVLSVQIQGDSQISLKIAGRNNEPTEFVLRASALSTAPSGLESGFSVSNDLTSSPDPISDDLTRKNIVDYLRQESAIRQNALFDSMLGGMGTLSPALGQGVGISQHSSTIQNPSLHSSTFRPNNIPSISVQNPVPRGSPLSTNFTFSKSPGAFHTPVPRLPISPSSVNKIIQQGNRPLGQPLSLGTGGQINSNSHSMSAGISNFNPVGTLRLTPLQSPSYHSQNSIMPPLSSSPTSAMMMDLPPPPPYPHNSRPGKPVTASSPLLVNLLQTDPLMVTAGNASGNPNKPLTPGDSEMPPAKKKKRTKRSKDGLVKPFSFNEKLTNSNPAFSQVHSNTGIDLNQITRVTEDSYTVNLPTSFNIRDSSVDLVQSRAGALPVSHLPDSFIPSIRPDSKPSFISDRPFSESHKDNPSSKFQFDTSISAIGVSNVSYKHSDFSVREHLPKDLDPFNLEITAGKIVNPYTGQLEPRDSADNGHLNVRDQSSHAISDNFATQMLAKKAKEIDEINKISVPNSSTHMLDVHVGTVSPIPVSLSNSTAGFIRSGPYQACNDRLNSIPPYRRNFISDSSVKDLKHSTQQNIYAVPAKQDISGNLISETTTLTHSLSNTSHKNLPNKSTAVCRTLSSPSVSYSGPLLSATGSTVNVSSSHMEFMETSSLPTGILSTLSGSVIHPNNSTATHLSQISLTQSLTKQAVPPIVEATRIQPVSSHHPNSVLSDRFPTLPQIQNQAADTDIGTVHNTKLSSSHLLNSYPQKHIDSLNSNESPLEKVASEGDDNSNHSVIATDSLPEISGAAALLEHSGVKTENHDSGLGSSSERSDDTPSEPGDEFRSSNITSESDENNSKTQQTKHSPASCKLESKMPTSITVGYIMNPADNSLQSKLMSKYSNHFNVKETLSLTKSANTNAPQLTDAQIKSNEKVNGQQVTTSINWSTESKTFYQSSSSNFLRDNPDLVSTSQKINGPISTSNTDKMLATVSESQQVQMRSSPKQNIKKDISSEHIKLQAEVLEKLSKINQFNDSTKIVADYSKGICVDKADSPDTITRTVNTEEKGDHLIFDMEELVNGKTLGNGGAALECKAGGNITSIYSKRSSPVNVNMLNHIYAPGLPLPRRLTESVQRLVKPLPASESSAALPQVRTCKSPAGGNSIRATSSASISNSRVSFQSGTRSPGASMPKLIPSDKYSLLSGGLDLAGLSGLQHSHGGDTVYSSKLSIPVMTADLSLKDTLTSPLSPKFVFDAKSFDNKMLSQSYPPHKYKENNVCLPQEKNDQNNMAQSSHLNAFPISKFEIPHLSQESRNFRPGTNQDHHHSQSNKVSEIENNIVSSKITLHSQMLTMKDTSHSSHDNTSVEISIANSSHSNALSPVMPVLQQGQDITVDLPNISSHPPFLSSYTEISQLGSSSSTFPLSTTGSTVVALSVPYTTVTSNTLNSSSSPKISSCGSPLPTLYPIPASTAVVNKLESTIVSKVSLSDSPPKLTRVSLPCNLPPLSPRTSSHSNRNIFESVSSTLSSEHNQNDLSVSALSSDTKEWLSRAIHKKSMESDKNATSSSSSDLEKNTTPFTLIKKFDQFSRIVLPSTTVEDKNTVLADSSRDRFLKSDQQKSTLPELASQDKSTPYISLTSTTSFKCPDTVSLNVPTEATVSTTNSDKIANKPSPTSLKEPILETIASTLSVAVPKPFPTKSPLNELVSIELDDIEESKAEDNESLFEKQTTCSSKDYSTSISPIESDVTSLNCDSNNGESQMPADFCSLESSVKRVTRKRKSTHSEEDLREVESETSSIDTTPVKQSTSSQIFCKQKTVSVASSKLESNFSNKPFKEISTLKTYSRVSNLGNGEFQNKGLKLAAGNLNEEKDVTHQPRPIKISCEDKEITVKENLHLSNDSKDQASKETGSNITDSDTRPKKPSEDKDSTNAIESLVIPSDADEQKDSQQLTSFEEKGKVGNKDLIDKPSSQGNEEGHKKGHRIKRQFYAYVPEKSIDQTYFDTPILSGRTRSKNKPAEQAAETGLHDGSATSNEANHVESVQMAIGKGDSSVECGSAKRPTRSVRARDNPQDQSSSKRRKVQQHR